MVASLEPLAADGAAWPIGRRPARASCALVEWLTKSGCQTARFHTNQILILHKTDFYQIKLFTKAPSK
jgi:hypothetical protein